MNSILSSSIAFTIGSAIGGVVAWKILETKYKRIADEEIESVKRVYASTREEFKPKEFEPKKFEPDTLHASYPELVKGLYSNESEGDDVKTKAKPYVITPEEFGEKDDYEAESLTYYADDVLTDNYDNVIKDLKGTVGKDFKSHFGEYEDDSVFIRNDELKTDYEILRDSRCFTDIYDTTDEDPTED